MTVSPKKTLHELNGLRLIAILMLIYFHYFALIRYFVPDFSSQGWEFIFNFADYGFTGTGLFFILSGFILTYIYWKPGSAQLRIAPAQFLFLRFSRIYPLHLLLLFVLLLLSMGNSKVPFTLQQWWVQTALLQSFFPHQAEAWNFPSWALSSLLIFYALFPSLVARLSRLSRRQRALLTGLTYLFILSLDAVYLWFNPDSLRSYNAASQGFYLSIIKFSPIVWLAFFIAGVSAGINFAEIQSSSRALRGPWADGIALALVLIHLAGAHIPYVFLRHGLLLPLQLGLIVCLCRQESRVGAWLKMPFMRRWGERSLTMYLLHVPVLYAFVSSPLMNRNRLGVLFVAYSMALFILSYYVDRYLVQSIALRLRRFWEQKVNGKAEGKMSLAGNSSSRTSALNKL